MLWFARLDAVVNGGISNLSIVGAVKAFDINGNPDALVNATMN